MVQLTDGYNDEMVMAACFSWRRSRDLSGPLLGKLRIAFHRIGLDLDADFGGTLVRFAANVLDEYGSATYFESTVWGLTGGGGDCGLGPLGEINSRQPMACQKTMDTRNFVGELMNTFGCFQS